MGSYSEIGSRPGTAKGTGRVSGRSDGLPRPLRGLAMTALRASDQKEETYVYTPHPGHPGRSEV